MGTNPASIDLVITNMTSLFMKSCTVETEISDRNNLMASLCRTTFAKDKSEKFFYRCYKNFDRKIFEDTLIKSTVKIKTSWAQ